MKVWITKYALTEGIIEAEGDIYTVLPMNSSGIPNSDMFCCSKIGFFKDYSFPNFHGEGREWHRTEKAAKIKANQMVAAKIGSLKKSLAKFMVMEF
jgi:hypothetical protein